MKFYDLIKLSTRMFKAKTSRTLLTVLGMSVGISAIIFLVSLGYGLQNTILQRITTSDSILTLDVSLEKTSPAVLDQATLENIRQMEEVSEISPIVELNAQAKLGDLKSELSVWSINQSYFKLSGIKIAQGKNLNEKNIEEIVIGSSVAKIFNKEPGDMIGQEVAFTLFVPEKSMGLASEEGNEKTKKVESGKKYIIAGVVDNGENIAYLNYASMDNLGISNVDTVKVKCKTTEMMKKAGEKISKMGFSISSISETVDQANKVFNVIKIILMLFGIIALVVSAIGMFNTMTVTLLERTEEIGIMKAIGASDMAISLMFVIESAIMGLLGGLGGILIGWMEGKMFNFAVNLIAVHFGGEKINLFYSPVWFVSLTVIFAALVGFITGLIPAHRASRIDPLEALRYK